jgi:hypothetical protein
LGGCRNHIFVMCITCHGAWRIDWNGTVHWCITAKCKTLGTFSNFTLCACICTNSRFWYSSVRWSLSNCPNRVVHEYYAARVAAYAVAAGYNLTRRDGEHWAQRSAEFLLIMSESNHFYPNPTHYRQRRKPASGQMAVMLSAAVRHPPEAAKRGRSWVIATKSSCLYKYRCTR